MKICERLATEGSSQADLDRARRSAVVLILILLHAGLPILWLSDACFIAPKIFEVYAESGKPVPTVTQWVGQPLILAQRYWYAAVLLLGLFLVADGFLCSFLFGLGRVPGWIWATGVLLIQAVLTLVILAGTFIPLFVMAI